MFEKEQSEKIHVIISKFLSLLQGYSIQVECYSKRRTVHIEFFFLINRPICGQLTFDKDAKTIQWEKKIAF